ncbi:unnamed protein product, partial [Amoebophrya sp. A25]|eukprot:GSA25T00023314001.1
MGGGRNPNADVLFGGGTIGDARYFAQDLMKAQSSNLAELFEKPDLQTQQRVFHLKHELLTKLEDQNVASDYDSDETVEDEEEEDFKIKLKGGSNNKKLFADSLPVLGHGAGDGNVETSNPRPVLVTDSQKSTGSARSREEPKVDLRSLFRDVRHPYKGRIDCFDYELRQKTW